MSFAISILFVATLSQVKIHDSELDPVNFLFLFSNSV